MLGLFISDVYAQTAGAAPAAPSAFASMMPLVIVFAIFYMLMIRPQQKKAQKEREYVASIQKGTEIYTKSGIIGTITALSDKVVTIEVEGGNKIKILRSHIGGAIDDILGKANNKDSKDNKAVASKSKA